jgi:hypothetical protein
MLSPIEDMLSGERVTLEAGAERGAVVRRAVGVVVGVVVLVSGSACSSGGDEQALSVTPLARTSTTHQAPPSSSTTSPKPAPAAPAPPAPARNAALATALDTLAARSRVVKSNASLAGVRTTLSTGLAATRKGLLVTRTAAYHQSPRSCAAVASGVGATRAGTATVARGATALSSAGATRQQQLTALQAAITWVRALAAKASPGTAPSAAEVAAAVKAAQAQHDAEAAALLAVRRSASDSLSRARSMSASASAIYSKAC